MKIGTLPIATKKSIDSGVEAVAKTPFFCLHYDEV